MNLLIHEARVVCVTQEPLPRASVRVRGEHIVEMGALRPEAGEQVINARGRVLMPGFVDAHTHALWVGNRFSEFEARQQGKTYLEILEAGGGIFSTVRAVRAASEAELRAALRARLEILLDEGTTSVEVKSGYGLDTHSELKMLRAIQSVAAVHPGTVVATALLGHALDPENPELVEQVVEETLPRVHEEFPNIAVDAYCERGAWSVDECRRLFVRAKQLGHSLRLHTDQFNALGGLEMALSLDALSVDHLEATAREGLERAARSGAYCVALPASGFFVDDRYADARTLLEHGAKLVLASNCNPGSAPTSSMPFVVALAARKLGLSPSEAIVAVTKRPAELLGLSDRGEIAPGKRADLVLLRHSDERALAYELGGNPVDSVICGGELVCHRVE